MASQLVANNNLNNVFFYGRHPESLLHKNDNISEDKCNFLNSRENIIYRYPTKETRMNNVYELFHISKAEFVCFLFI